MNIYLVGCEYAGKTTLAGEIMEWAERTMGGTRHFHDHMTIPSSELLPEARASYQAVHPQVKEMLQRYMLSYHISPEMYRGHADANLMGHAIEEAVYAPLYYGYGGKDTQASFRSGPGQRTEMARRMEETILFRAPNTLLILLKAAPEVIRQRMREQPTAAADAPMRGVVQEADIEYVLQRFEEEFEWSLIGNKMVLDTSTATVAETMAEFLAKFSPYLTENDKKRMRQ